MTDNLCYFDNINALIPAMDQPCPKCGDLGTGYGADGVSRCPYGFIEKENNE